MLPFHAAADGDHENVCRLLFRVYPDSASVYNGVSYACAVSQPLVSLFSFSDLLTLPSYGVSHSMVNCHRICIIWM